MEDEYWDILNILNTKLDYPLYEHIELQYENTVLTATSYVMKIIHRTFKINGKHNTFLLTRNILLTLLLKSRFQLYAT